jgi:cobalt-precorrin-7 (C5)-methyltransferase
MGIVYAVGVGPGSQDYVTGIAKKIIQTSDIIVGYKYTLKTIENLLSDKEVYEITMRSQEEVYQKITSDLVTEGLINAH